MRGKWKYRWARLTYCRHYSVPSSPCWCVPLVIFLWIIWPSERLLLRYMYLPKSCLVVSFDLPGMRRSNIFLFKSKRKHQLEFSFFKYIFLLNDVHTIFMIQPCICWLDLPVLFLRLPFPRRPSPFSGRVSLCLGITMELETKDQRWRIYGYWQANFHQTVKEASASSTLLP